ncbi:MAG: hypothetical protein ACRYGG_23260, partial [Janthinobacterium lividum]
KATTPQELSKVKKSWTKAFDDDDEESQSAGSFLDAHKEAKSRIGNSNVSMNTPGSGNKARVDQILRSKTIGNKAKARKMI